MATAEPLNDAEYVRQKLSAILDAERHIDDISDFMHSLANRNLPENLRGNNRGVLFDDIQKAIDYHEAELAQRKLKEKIKQMLYEVMPFIKKRGCGGAIKPIPSGMGYMDSPTSAPGGHSMVGG